MTRVSEVMTRGVRAMAPTDTMQFAAQAMDELNVGVVPVCDGERLVGIVTDRDIAIRGVAQGCPGDSTPLERVMSTDVRWCFEDQPLEEVVRTMGDAQIRRLPVVDHAKHLVGMLSLGDVAAKAGERDAAEALAEISAPAEPDRSGLSKAAGAAAGGADSSDSTRKHG